MVKWCRRLAWGYFLPHEVTGLVATVKTVNNKLVQDAREKAISSIDKKIAQIGKLLDAAGSSAETRNKALYPLQEPKKRLQYDVSIPNIAYTIGEVEEIYEVAVDLIENETDDDDSTPPKKIIKTIRPANLTAKTYLETEEDIV